MKKLYVLIAIISVLLSGCDKKTDSLNEFTITGIVVVAPDNTPVRGAIVSITNGVSVIEYTTTDNDGKFSLTIDRRYIDGTYYLSISETTLKATREYEILGYGQSIYDYGYIILYDFRNPYNLPSFKYNGYTYLVHPILSEESNRTAAINICENLHDFERIDWFLPNRDELVYFFNSLDKKALKDYPVGSFCTSTRSITVRIIRWSDDEWEIVTDYYDDGEINGKVLPMARY